MKRLVLAVAAAIALALGGGISIAHVTRPVGVLEAVRRAQPERVLVARFSFDIPYHACTPDTVFADSTVQRETCGAPSNTRLNLSDLAAARHSLDADSLRASAFAAVHWQGQTEVEPLDEAIETLMKARAVTRAPVPVLVDLSAVHLERAARTQSPRDAVDALEFAMEALELEPGNLHALFNAALAAEAFSLRDKAVERWNRYLAADSTSPWAREARWRRDSLLHADRRLPTPGLSSSPAEVRAFAAAHPQEAREHGLEWALGEWGKAVREGNTARADSLLALARGLGSALEAQGGDASLADAVAGIRAAQPRPAATRTLARAHHAYAAGVRLFKAGQWSAAIDSFEVVLRLRPASRALLGWTRAAYIAALLQNGRGGEVEGVLKSLSATMDSVRTPALRARMDWIEADRMPSGASGRRDRFDQAARTYHRLDEAESYGATQYRVAWTAHEDGNTTVAYRMSSKALRALRPYRGSRHLHGVLVQAADLARRDGMSRAALLIQAEDETVGMSSPNPTVQVEALQARARTRVRVGSTELARQDLDSAESLLNKLPEKAQRDYLDNAQRYSRALLASARDAGSVAALDTVVSYFRTEGSGWLLMALVRRVELLLMAGQLDRADADLDSLAAEIHTLAPGDLKLHHRAEVMERMRSSHDRLVMAYVRAGQPLCALRALERSRIKFAFDSTTRESPREWKAPPPGHVVLEYALIGDTLLTWVVRRDSITLREQRLNRDALLRTIARVGVALEGAARAEAADTALRGLHNVLIRPVLDRIPTGDGTELVIVADGEIAGIPFPALRNSADGHYLVEAHPIRFAASLADAARDASAVPARWKALLVANPRFDQRANRELRGLPGAAAEAAALRGRYPESVLLVDSAATVDAFRKQAAQAPVIHYAGHAVFNNARPERSFLLLAGDSTSGRLTADTVASMQLDGVRLVVLSACRTLRGGEGRSSGFAGLSGALLNAGADGVVGSLWLVSDKLTQPLMVALHEHYLRDPDPARALREAQMAMIRGGSSPAVWAGFRYMGR